MQALALDGIFSGHLALELVNIVLTLNMTQDLNCCLLHDLRLLNLVTAVLKSLRL